MRGHWTSQTRKLNRHYQSGGAKERLILWDRPSDDPYTSGGIGSNVAYTINSGSMPSEYIHAVTLSPGYYKLKHDLHTNYTTGADYDIGIVYAQASSGMYMMPYFDDNTEAHATDTHAGTRVYARQIAGTFTFAYSPKSTQQTQVLIDAHSTLFTREAWLRRNIISQNYTQYFYRPDKSTLYEELGEQRTFAGDPYYFTDSQDIVLDYTWLTGPTTAGTQPFEMDYYDQNGNHITGPTFTKDPLISVCIGWSGGLLQNYEIWGDIWLERV